MLDRINKEVKTWDWKAQTIWSHKIWQNGTPVWVVLSRIERWEYNTKNVDIDLETININSYSFDSEMLFDFMVHYQLIQNASLDYPIILNRKWVIIDGRHRVAKAILEWHKTIKWIIITNSDIYE